MTSTNCYLVRHSHAVWSPDPMRSLSVQGRAAADHVRDRLGGCKIVAIYSSPHRRARQTVEPLAEHLRLPIHEREALLERSLGAGDTEPLDDFEAAVRATWQDPDFRFPGGESNAEAQRRAVAIYQDLTEQHPGDSIVLATHGTLLALLLNQFDDEIGFEFWQNIDMPDIYRLRIDDRRVADVRHIGWRA